LKNDGARLRKIGGINEVSHIESAKWLN